MTTLCGRCPSCRAGIPAQESFRVLEPLCAGLKPELTRLTDDFYQVSMGVLGYANLTRTGRRWSGEVRDRDGGYRRFLSISTRRADLVEQAISILRFE